MDSELFVNSLSDAQPPKSLPPHLLALWYDAKGDWEKAHHIINDMPGQTAAWVHAYLHRKEGDMFNARYWYRAAGKPPAISTLDQEWKELIKALM